MTAQVMQEERSERENRLTVWVWLDRSRMADQATGGPAQPDRPTMPDPDVVRRYDWSLIPPEGETAETYFPRVWKELSALVLDECRRLGLAHPGGREWSDADDLPRDHTI